jgi:hypothetical protein
MPSVCLQGASSVLIACLQSRSYPRVVHLGDRSARGQDETCNRPDALGSRALQCGHGIGCRFRPDPFHPGIRRIGSSAPPRWSTKSLSSPTIWKSPAGAGCRWYGEEFVGLSRAGGGDQGLRSVSGWPAFIRKGSACCTLRARNLGCSLGDHPRRNVQQAGAQPKGSGRELLQAPWRAEPARTKIND